MNNTTQIEDSVKLTKLILEFIENYLETINIDDYKEDKNQYVHMLLTGPALFGAILINNLSKSSNYNKEKFIKILNKRLDFAIELLEKK